MTKWHSQEWSPVALNRAEVLRAETPSQSRIVLTALPSLRNPCKFNFWLMFSHWSLCYCVSFVYRLNLFKPLLPLLYKKPSVFLGLDLVLSKFSVFIYDYIHHESLSDTIFGLSWYLFSLYRQSYFHITQCSWFSWPGVGRGFPDRTYFLVCLHKETEDNYLASLCKMFSNW